MGKYKNIGKWKNTKTIENMEKHKNNRK